MAFKATVTFVAINALQSHAYPAFSIICFNIAHEAKGYDRQSSMYMYHKQ